MKRWLMVLMVCLCLSMPLIPGCKNTTPAQRMAMVQATVTQATVLSQKLDASVVELKAVVQTCEMMLQDPNIPPEMKPQILTNLNLATAKLDNFLQQKSKVDVILAQSLAILNSADMNNATIGTEIQTYGQAIQVAAMSLPPPYNAYAYILAAFGVPFAGFVLTWLKQRQTAVKLNESKTALTDVVTSVNALIDPANKVVTPDKVAEAKAVLQDNQTGATQDTVDAILDPMQNTGPTN